MPNSNVLAAQFTTEEPVGPPADPPVWAAALSQQNLDQTGSFVFEPQLIGTVAQPTFNHTATGSDLLLPDSDGVYWVIPDGKPTAYGARAGGGAAGRAILVAQGWDIEDGGLA
jgi:hypothetical protein